MSIIETVEKEINGISGVDEIISTSIEGFSSIQVTFDFSATPTEALRKVKDKVDAATSDKDFPKDLPADPSVQELNFAELMPIMNINLSGDFSLDQFIGKKYVILFFYPKDFTFVCPSELHAFQAKLNEFKKRNNFFSSFFNVAFSC